MLADIGPRSVRTSSVSHLRSSSYAHGVQRACASPAASKCRKSRAFKPVRAWDSDSEARWHLHDVQSVNGSGSAAPVAGPGATLRRVLEVVRDRDLDGMLEFCPDEVIDRLIALRKETGSTADVHFEDIINANSKDLLYLDTFALRNLIMTAPASVQLLSAMHVTPERYLQRCAIVSPSGEECVLTFSTTLQEVSECQYRGPPLLSQKWMLQSVTGECNSHELPSHPSPSFPPEAVVEAQLAALREGRVASVFAHASPENKASTGPVEKFAAMLHHHPAYSPLMGHFTAETVERLQPSETTYMEVVRVTPAPKQQPKAAAAAANIAAASSPKQLEQQPEEQQQQQQSLMYMWILSRQTESSAWSNCWMTDAVQPLPSAPSAFSR